MFKAAIGPKMHQMVSKIISFRVLGNAESGVFLRQLLVLYAYIFLLGILIYTNSFSADASQTP